MTNKTPYAMKITHHQSIGFTLIEMLIALSIATTVAYLIPSAPSIRIYPCEMSSMLALPHGAAAMGGIALPPPTDTSG